LEVLGLPTAVNQLHCPRGEAEDYQISLMITAQSFIPLNERLREALRPGGNLRPSSETVFDGPGFVRREH